MDVLIRDYLTYTIVISSFFLSFDSTPLLPDKLSNRWQDGRARKWGAGRGVGENSSPFSMVGRASPCSVADKSRLSYARCRTSGWKRRVLRRPCNAAAAVVVVVYHPILRVSQRQIQITRDLSRATTRASFTPILQGFERDLNSSFFLSFLPSSVSIQHDDNSY